MPKYPFRSASFIITFLAATSNLAIALQVLAAWSSLKWEQSSEWESSDDSWKLDSLQVVWGLFLAYFSAASVVSAVGFAGVVKSKRSLVKFYRDYSIADFSFCAFITLIIGYGIFQPTLSVSVCEGLSQHPDFMRDLAELGLSSENCERWFRRSSLIFLAIMLIVLVARLHFLLAVGIYYSHLARYHSQRSPVSNNSHLTHSRSRSIQRVLLLPHVVPGVSTFPLSPRSNGENDRSVNDEELVMYAPLPLHSLPEELARDLRRNATETWVTSAKPDEKTGRSSHRHRHHHSRGHGHESVMNGSGQISLPILPDEGLLPDTGLSAKV
ncbi:hypothetical protein GYMLUDRAFT_36321 [Collybiopsis luxurians FD-317 M1]|nr:hypothetical protein GYMLUDRAFT_36321 [Collybiopsis luxurians FD-317 M1]